MDRRNAVLEYHITETNEATAPKWGFRFKGMDGQTLMESPRAFDSPAKAEEGFIAMIKLIASNQYTIDSPELPHTGG